MKIDLRIFKSRVARRIFTLFVLCALLPILALAFFSFGHVTEQLYDQTQRRIHQECKSIGMAIMERLLFLETELEAVANAIEEARVPNFDMKVLNERFKERLSQRFVGLAVLEEGKNRLIYGHFTDPARPNDREWAHLQSGKTVVTTTVGSQGLSRVFMMRLLGALPSSKTILLGEIRTDHLWGIGEMNTLPALSELSVFDEERHILLSSIALPQDFQKHLAAKANGSKERRFEWTDDGNTYLASYWTLFLEPQYCFTQWTLVLSQAKAVALSPVAYFKKTFPFVVLMAFWIVVLFSAILIRRNLVPLEKLKDATIRIAKGDFSKAVDITSNDEFKDLATSFNIMCKRLERQFRALTTIADIDRTVLGSLDSKSIVHTVLINMGGIVRCDMVAIALKERNTKDTLRMYYRTGGATKGKTFELQPPAPGELAALRKSRHHLVISDARPVPSYLKRLWHNEAAQFLVLPVFLNEDLVGLVALGFNEPPILHEEEAAQLRQIADQVGVALSNAGLLEDLDQLNWGTLLALARAVDAKSPWTAGHSERVTGLAIAIGKAMGLETKDLELLKRGGLLHDLGKIGVPAEVLDKSAKLTDEEYKIMKNHSSMGARILEPISAYKGIIPLVEQHHEKYDGTGYPFGLCGEKIHFGARILAVADVFDALVSDRPYRSGWEREKALAFMKEQSGSHFDPQVIEVFFRVIEGDDARKQPEKIAVQAPILNSAAKQTPEEIGSNAGVSSITPLIPALDLKTQEMTASLTEATS